MPAQILLEEGYGALTMRAVAARCGIAVGTVYNYFPAKDMMVGNVILAGWLATLGKHAAGLRAGQRFAERDPLPI